jgi:hypothetical protein
MSVKKTTNNSIDIINAQIKSIDFATIFENIQNEISYNSDYLSVITSINDTLIKINTSNENIQSGKETATDNLYKYVNSLLRDISEAKSSFLTIFLSSAQQTLYSTQDITIDDIVNIDLFSFYNSLQKIKIQVDFLKGILNSIVKQDDIRYYANSDDYTLTTEQFDSGDENKVENTTNFYYYTIQEGDTLRIIASRELNDPDKYISILKINNINDNDLIDGTMIGTQIKIPMDLNILSRGDDNLIYESDVSDIAKFLFGTDLKTGLNKELMISSKGDLRSEEGIENAYQNILNRVKNRKGSLNVFNPNWGTIAVDDSNAPVLVKIARYLDDVIDQIQSEPRVESVKMNLEKLKYNGEVLESSYNVYFIGADEHREVTV